MNLQLYNQNNEETIKLKENLIKIGINNNDIENSYNSIKKVWSSKYNERVYININKYKLDINKIKMSILIQKIIPAEYAFVIHTKNPFNNNKNELFCEIVIGMGEALVGNYEGQSFSFIYYKNEKKFEIKSFCNKSICIKNNGFIFRSDSNFEDMKNFSGAGLFDSIPLYKDNLIYMKYWNEKLFCDDKFREDLINKISNLGIMVEKLYDDMPQDIEGVYYDNYIYIVQTRPQV